MPGDSLSQVPECSIGELILPKLKSLPKDDVFLIDGETGIEQTVGQFLSNGLQLLEGLKKIGLNENDVIGMLCKNGFEANSIVLASWIGAATLAPVNSSMKVSELKHALSVIRPKFIFCEDDVLEKVQSALGDSSSDNVTIILVNENKNSKYANLRFKDVLVNVDVDTYKPQPVKCPGRQLAVISPSSGTSGLPKGIGISHKNLVFQNMVLEKIDLFDKTEICLQLSHFYWITAILMFLRSLTLGTKRIFLNVINPENTFKAIEKYNPTFTILAPLTLLGLTKHADFKKYNLSSLKYVLVGGSSLTDTMLVQIKEAWPKIKLYNTYGMTEASGIVCQNNDQDTSIGRVTPGVWLKIVDTTTGSALKSNSPGEICIHGCGVMAGYVNNEKATRESIDDDGWLHSGDVGYYDDDGKFFIVDRIKEMIKVRDMQVTPTEIENVILTVPGVFEVGVVGIPHERDIFHLMALVVKKENHSVKENDIHAAVNGTLSEYKSLTAGIRFIDFIPKTATGKIDRNTLKSIALELYA
ncbi:luciferase, putative [Pediculus humanus corporis]|uniref:Luciferase, putative n=1 Tax=Pediculus humanus subsp. corporis TaxID=121224 RepID=E0VZP9_PEDHC|nr:luciferase, putative [Pediculus humanus corporis]EEB18855.1 luciferase, putative [Pediculus humanus corporis]